MRMRLPPSEYGMLLIVETSALVDHRVFASWTHSGPSVFTKVSTVDAPTSVAYHGLLLAYLGFRISSPRTAVFVWTRVVR